jgi:hypothetical protein
MKTNKKLNQTKFPVLLFMLIAFVINFSATNVYATSSKSMLDHAKFTTIVPAPLVGNMQTYIPYAPFIVNTTTYTFGCSSDHSGYTYFNVSVNGVSISGTEAITTGSPVSVYDTNPVSNSSTVVVEITGGYMPTSSVLEGPFPVIWGTISGSTITFTDVPLDNGYVWCGLLLN